MKRLVVGVAQAASLNPSWQGTHCSAFTELNGAGQTTKHRAMGEAGNVALFSRSPVPSYVTSLSLAVQLFSRDAAKGGVMTVPGEHVLLAAEKQQFVRNFRKRQAVPRHPAGRRMPETLTMKNLRLLNMTELIENVTKIDSSVENRVLKVTCVSVG